MPGHEHQQRIVRQPPSREGIEQQRLLAVARACRQPDRAHRAETQAKSRPQLERRRWNGDIEFEVAGDDSLGSTELCQPRSVGC